MMKLPFWESKQRGFTLIELVVSMGVFIIVVSMATTSFLQGLRGQRQLAALIAAQSNASLVLEQMAREIRTGSKFCRFELGVQGTGGTPSDNDSPDTFRCNGLASVTNPISKFVFVDANFQKVMYRVDNGVITRRTATLDENQVTPPRTITADNVVVEHLFFVVLDGSDGSQPRVTISLGIKPKDATVQSVVTQIQTTVSSRQAAGS